MIDMSPLIHAQNETDFEIQFQKLMKYPNETWKNLANIKDPQKLQTFEYTEVAKQSIHIIKNGLKIKSTKDLSDIHKMLFANVYPWAGQFRVYDISKGGTDFLPARQFNTGIKDIEQYLNQYNQKDKLDPKEYATLLDHINYLHPFPEGNGRSTKVFLQCLANNHGQELNYERNQQAMIQCLNQADVDGIANHLKVTDLKLDYQKTNNQTHNENLTL